MYEHFTETKRKQEASFAECRECHQIINPSLYWGLSQVAWLHTSGTGHNKFIWFKRA